MSDQKSNCESCGVTILGATYATTGGFCVTCKRKKDLEQKFKKFRADKQEKTEKLRHKYGGRFKFFFTLFIQLLMIFALLLQIFTHYPKIFIESNTQFISLLLVITSVLGIVIISGIIIYSLMVNRVHKNKK